MLEISKKEIPSKIMLKDSIIDPRINVDNEVKVSKYLKKRFKVHIQKNILRSLDNIFFFVKQIHKFRKSTIEFIGDNFDFIFNSTF